MAYNWTVKEMYEKYLSGDAACIADAGKRFPFAARVLAMIGDNQGGRELVNSFPDNFTANKLNGYLKATAGVSDTGDDGEEAADEKPVKQTGSKGRGRKPKATESDNKERAGSEMDAFALYKDCVARGLDPEKKKPVKYYKDLIAKDEAAKAADDADGWDDDDNGGDDDDWTI